MYDGDHISSSLGVLEGCLLCFGSPCAILVVSCSFAVHRGFHVGSHEQRFDFVHHLHQLLGWSPLISGLEHVCADLALFVNVRMVDLRLEGDDRTLEGEVIEFEFDFELSSLEGA